MGILMAGGGLVGILGALLYPRVRRRVGIERTGLFGFFLEVAFLCLCVASVWAPGSPFDPLSQRKVPNSIVSRNDTVHSNATVYSNVTQANITIVLSDASPKEADSETVTNISVWLLLAGIIGARCGKLYCLSNPYGSVVECLTRDREDVGLSLTGVSVLWSLSMTHLS